MALNKKKPGFDGSIPCFTHSLIYSLPFLLIASPVAVFVIFVTHYIIDRGHMVEHFLAFRNNVKTIDNFGFGKDRPFALTIWLLIITDNTFHLIINFLAIKFL